MELTNCPYCNSLLKSTPQIGYCNDDSHEFSGSSNESCWFLKDKKLGLQIGKSLSHPYYFYFINKKGGINIYLLDYIAIENCVVVLKQIKNLMMFI